MEDLIQNAHTLFDEDPSQSPPIPSSGAAETTSILTYGSFLSPEMPQSAEVQATGSTSQHRSGLVSGISVSTQSPFSSFPSDDSVESRLAQQPSGLLSPLSWSKTLTEGAEMTTEEQLIPEGRATEAIGTLRNRTLPDAVPLTGAASVAEWRLHQSRLPPDPEALRIPQSPPESILSSTSEFPLSSATSLQTRLWSP
jgi:hypothetical protein